MSKLSRHIKKIHKIKGSLIYFANQLQDKELEKLIYNNAEKYISIFEEAFSIDKEIKTDMKYFADVRNLAQYNEDLVNGWLVEDFYIYVFNLPIFKEHGFHVEISNHDSDRVIKKKRDFINSSPDFLVKYGDVSFRLEIQALLKDVEYFHIKENKAKRAEEENSFIFQLMLGKKETIYFFPYLIRTGQYGPNEKWGGKYAYKFNYRDIPQKRIIKSKDLISESLFLFYLFAYYKKFGQQNFIEFGKNSIGLSKEEIIRNITSSL